jgi:IS30 family transposase
MHKVSNYRQLSKDERIKIEVLYHQGFSLAAISRELGRSASTICREIRRNGSRNYRANCAEALCRKRHRSKPKRLVFTRKLKAFVVRLLREGQSPEIICHEGKKRFGRFVSTEWIYQWIWRMKFSQKRADKPLQGLFKYLIHACRKRKRGLRRNRRGNIIDRVFLDQRPGEADRRSEKGHLEGDIVLGLDRQPGLLVVLDRQSRRTWLRKLPTKDADFVSAKLKDICRQAKCKTLTLDNDQSFAHHYELKKLGIKTFFTHPYSSQEKGSVENRIGLIRWHFPKKTDFTKVSHMEVKRVENWLNNRPMRMFEYRTPREVHQNA